MNREPVEKAGSASWGGGAAVFMKLEFCLISSVVEERPPIWQQGRDSQRPPHPPIPEHAPAQTREWERWRGRSVM